MYQAAGDHEGMDTLGNHKILFPRNMGKEFEEMRIKFGSTFFKVRRNFLRKQKDLNIDEIKALVTDCFPVLKSELNDKKTINEVLDVAKRKCNIINIRPLEVLIIEFNIKEAEEIIKEYKKKAKDFCKKISVRLCLDEKLQAAPTPSRLKSETVVFIFNWNPDKSTLQDINDVLDELEPLENYCIHIDQAEPDRSVAVICYCPAEYTGSLITTVLEKIEMLQKRGLKEFIVGNYTVWDCTANKVI